MNQEEEMAVVRARRAPKPKARQRVWRIEGSAKPPGSYSNNLNCEVVAYTLEGALEAVRAKFPDAVLHKIMAERWVTDVILSREKAPK